MTDPLDPAATLLTQGADVVRQTPAVPAAAPHATELPDEINPAGTLITHGAHTVRQTPEVSALTPHATEPSAALRDFERIAMPNCQLCVHHVTSSRLCMDS